MESLPQILEKLKQATNEAEQEKCLDRLINLVNEKYKDDEDDVQKAIVDSSAIMTILPFLNHASGFAALSAKTAQLIAELAKTESLRVPLVELGVVPPLLELLKTSGLSICIATQVCRALGNICFDNDLGRTAVDDGDGISTLLGLLEKYTENSQDGAAKLRVIVCGFILNLTNECELLQDRAVEGGALRLLDRCLREHADDEDLVNMALATIISIADSEKGKAQLLSDGLLDTLVWVVSREDTGPPLMPVLEELNTLAESEAVKDKLADGQLPAHLIRIIKHNTDCVDRENDPFVKLSSDLLLSLLVGDGSMEKLYGGGEGLVFRQCVQWLEADSECLKVLGALAVGNFARSDAHCRQLVDSGIVESLLYALQSTNEEDSNFTLQHAVLSSMRNLAIPAPNKERLLEAGVLQAVLSLKYTEVMAVAYKLLGVLRMLIDGQEAAAVSLGEDRDFLICLVDWCGVDEHAGVKGEATRLMASMIKNSKSAQVMRNIVREEGISHLVTMATSEHVVMQNEALVALNLLASTVLGSAAVSLKKANLIGTISELLKNKDISPEMLCNTMTLVRSLCSAASPSASPSLPCSLLACTGFVPDVLNSLRQEFLGSGVVENLQQLSRNHVSQSVKDAAISTLSLLEELNR